MFTQKINVEDSNGFPRELVKNSKSTSTIPRTNQKVRFENEKIPEIKMNA